MCKLFLFGLSTNLFKVKGKYRIEQESALRLMERYPGKYRVHLNGWRSPRINSSRMEAWEQIFFAK